MSFLLYNPMEAFVLILPMWILHKNEINWNNKNLLFKVFIKDCYIISTILLTSQILLSLLANTLIYIILDIFCTFCIFLALIVYSRKRFKKTVYLTSLIITILYSCSLSLITAFSPLYEIFINGETSFWQELFLNFYIKVLQTILFIFLFGGFIMFKKKLIKEAKQNLGKTVAPTLKLVGESKLSEKLKREVKNSK